MGIDIFHESIHGDKAQGTRNQTLHGLGRVFCWCNFWWRVKKSHETWKKHISFQLGDKGIIFLGPITSLIMTLLASLPPCQVGFSCGFNAWRRTPWGAPIFLSHKLTLVGWGL